MPMTVRTRPHRSSSRPRLIGRVRKASAAEPEARPATARQPSPFAREREAGGPEDRASYRCSCGCVFEASVSTSVGCPHCGSTQAW